MIGMLVRMGSIDFFDGSPNGGEPGYPAIDSKNAINLSKTVVMAFERRKASCEAAVFLNSLSEIKILQNSVKTGTILHGSRNCRGIQTAYPELYNTVEVKNYAE